MKFFFFYFGLVVGVVDPPIVYLELLSLCYLSTARAQRPVSGDHSDTPRLELIANLSSTARAWGGGEAHPAVTIHVV